MSRNRHQSKHRNKPYRHQEAHPAHPVTAARVEPKAASPKEWLLLILFWSCVLIPLGWGIKSTVEKALLLFR